MHHFAKERTQSMWTCSSEMMDGVKQMFDEDLNNIEKQDAYEKAVKRYQIRVKECRMGYAPEQHLNELLNIFNRDPVAYRGDLLGLLTSSGLSSKEIDEALIFYETPGWTIMKKDAACISILSSPFIAHQGLGQGETGNITMGLVMHDHAINGYLVANHSKHSEIAQLVAGWQEALGELGDFFEVVPDQEKS